jgi:hypothetical protein
VPIKVLVLTVTVTALVSIWPALTNGSSNDHERAIFGLLVLTMFMAMGITFAVAISDSYVEVDDASVYVRFEAFFTAEFPIEDIIAVRIVDPQPRWRYRFGLSTNFADRIACSHGGPMVEVELAHAWRTRLWPRTIAVHRFWLGVQQPDAFVAELRRRAPHLALGPQELAAAA